MSIIIKNKSTFDTIQVDNVSNIAYDGTNYAITAGGSTTNYSAATYLINILYR